MRKGGGGGVGGVVGGGLGSLAVCFAVAVVVLVVVCQNVNEACVYHITSFSRSKSARPTKRNVRLRLVAD